MINTGDSLINAQNAQINSPNVEVGLRTYYSNSKVADASFYDVDCFELDNTFVVYGAMAAPGISVYSLATDTGVEHAGLIFYDSSDLPTSGASFTVYPIGNGSSFSDYRTDFHISKGDSYFELYSTGVTGTGTVGKSYFVDVRLAAFDGSTVTNASVVYHGYNADYPENHFQYSTVAMSKFNEYLYITEADVSGSTVPFTNRWAKIYRVDIENAGSSEIAVNGATYNIGTNSFTAFSQKPQVRYLGESKLGVIIPGSTLIEDDTTYSTSSEDSGYFYYFLDRQFYNLETGLLSPTERLHESKPYPKRNNTSVNDVVYTNINYVGGSYLTLTQYEETTSVNSIYESDINANLYRFQGTKWSSKYITTFTGNSYPNFNQFNFNAVGDDFGGVPLYYEANDNLFYWGKLNGLSNIVVGHMFDGGSILLDLIDYNNTNNNTFNMVISNTNVN